MQAILANLFVTKQIVLFGFIATASDALAVGCTLGLNLLQEYYGKAQAQKAVIVSFLCLVVYTILSALHVLYVPAPSDITQTCFTTILSGMPRIIAASLTAYFIVQNLDCWLYGKLKEKFNKPPKNSHKPLAPSEIPEEFIIEGSAKNGFNFTLKNYISVSITQLLDTVLFTFLGLYKLSPQFDSLNVMYQIIFVSYTIKIATILVSAPILTILKKIYKQ